jgi:hypothetical protein
MIDEVKDLLKSELGMIRDDLTLLHRRIETIETGHPSCHLNHVKIKQLIHAYFNYIIVWSNRFVNACNGATCCVVANNFSTTWYQHINLWHCVRWHDVRFAVKTIQLSQAYYKYSMLRYYRVVGEPTGSPHLAACENIPLNWSRHLSFLVFVGMPRYLLRNDTG